MFKSASPNLVALRSRIQGASLPRNVSVLSIVADLEGRDLDGLRHQWRAHLGGEAPAWLANHFDGLTALLALGVSLRIANVVAAIIWFRKRRLL